MNDFKLRIKSSVERFASKQLESNTRNKRAPRKSPEKLTEKQVMAWCKSRDFDLTVIDSGRMDSERIKVSEVGVSDLVGDLCIDGVAIASYIELKAEGQRKRVSISQYMFLLRKARRGSFVAVTDGVAHISSLLSRWLDSGRDKQVLIDDLPVNAEIKRYALDDSPLF